MTLAVLSKSVWSVWFRFQDEDDEECVPVIVVVLLVAVAAALLATTPAKHGGTRLPRKCFAVNAETAALAACSAVDDVVVIMFDVASFPVLPPFLVPIEPAWNTTIFGSNRDEGCDCRKIEESEEDETEAAADAEDDVKFVCVTCATVVDNSSATAGLRRLFVLVLLFSLCSFLFVLLLFHSKAGIPTAVLRLNDEIDAVL